MLRSARSDVPRSDVPRSDVPRSATSSDVPRSATSSDVRSDVWPNAATVLVNSQLTPSLLMYMTYSNRLVWPQQWHTQTRCADGLLLLHISSVDYLYMPAVVNCEVGSTRQPTVNTCLVNVYDVLKPPCMAATVAYSNPMRQRPIVVAYIQCGLLIRARVRWGV